MKRIDPNVPPNCPFCLAPHNPLHLFTVPKQNKLDLIRHVTSADGGRNVPQTRREPAGRAPDNGLMTKIEKGKKNV